MTETEGTLTIEKSEKNTEFYHDLLNKMVFRPGISGRGIGVSMFVDLFFNYSNDIRMIAPDVLNDIFLSPEARATTDEEMANLRAAIENIKTRNFPDKEIARRPTDDIQGARKNLGSVFGHTID